METSAGHTSVSGRVDAAKVAHYFHSLLLRCNVWAIAHTLAKLMQLSVSYGVVVFKSFGIPQANLAWVQRAMLDEVGEFALPKVWLTQFPRMFNT